MRKTDILNATTAHLIRFGILLYWVIFWLFNVVDKVIGGAHFLWVGRDRFAQFQKYFASAGLEAPVIADVSLIVAAALEVFAFLFFAGALAHFWKKNAEFARSWMTAGTGLTLLTFTIFSIGDHIFGDRFELLEHTLFWFSSIGSWAVFVHLDQKDEGPMASIPGRQLVRTGLISIGIAGVTTVSIFQYNDDFFYRRTAALSAEQVDADLYKVSFPFLGGSTVFEETLVKFLEEHPTKTVDHIYTVPKPLRLKKADALIFYIATKDKP